MAYPLPQAVDPGGWSVDAGRGEVDLTAREMRVPLGDDRHDALVRAHEQAHVRFSPRRARVAERHRLSYMFAEDGRIGLLAAALGVATVPHVDIALVDGASPRDRARVVLALQGSDDETAWRAICGSLSPSHRSCLLAALRVLREGVSDACSSLEAARLIDTLPGARMTSIPSRGQATRWGDLSHERAPMNRPAARGRSRALLADESGSALTFPHRYLLDGRVFGRVVRRRLAGGTLLIDGSASMRWTVEDIDRLLEAVPALLVAVYSGVRSEGVQRTGYLRIIAEGGSVADRSEFFSPRHAGGNVVDGPALRWLADQKPPRAWYSDGLVTGEGDLAAADNLVREVRALIAGAAIRRCGTLEEARDCLGAAAPA